MLSENVASLVFLNWKNCIFGVLQAMYIFKMEWFLKDDFLKASLKSQ